MTSLKNSTGGEECIRFSSLEPILEELGTNEILLHSQLCPLNQRVDLSDSRSSWLFSMSRPRSSWSFPSNSTWLSLSISPSSWSTTSLNLSLSLSLHQGDGFVSLNKIKGGFKKLYLLNRLSKIEAVKNKLKMKLGDVWKKNSFVQLFTLGYTYNLQDDKSIM